MKYRNFVIKAISFYQIFLSFDNGLLRLLAPGGACRYQQSCSQYTKQAIRDVGVIGGIWLGIKRVWSCR